MKLFRFIYVFRYLGFRWALYRIIYACKLKFRYFERVLPCSLWDKYSPDHFFEGNEFIDPSKYFEYRKKTPPAFFFSTENKGEYAQFLKAKKINLYDNLKSKNFFQYFGTHKITHNFRPDWFENPFTGQSFPWDVHWSRIDDFKYGDIKAIWEISRFSFVFELVRNYWKTNDSQYAEVFWNLIEDWREKNCPNYGPNWKCGQEVSFRMFAWCFGLYGFLDSTATTEDRIITLAQMIYFSGLRIELNISYALSQHNNHGISEAVGLWTIGVLFPEFNNASRWKNIGKRLLEKQVNELVYDDGSFSQHSLNYHRLLLHNLIWAIQVGKVNGEKFSQGFMDRVSKAGDFLSEFVNPKNGHAPNTGANDGSNILPLTDCDYRDYRPVLQAVSILIHSKRKYYSGPWDELVFWLGLDNIDNKKQEIIKNRDIKHIEKKQISHMVFPDGGYLCVRSGDSWGFLRSTENFLHRPVHADQLHLDLWWRGENILRDAGSFSYNAASPWDKYFKSCVAHNTVQFDDHDQMPEINRFLYGKWCETTNIDPIKNDGENLSWTGEYIDWKGCCHKRKIFVLSETWIIFDSLKGFKNKAVIRWRLDPDRKWHLKKNVCAASGVEFFIDTKETPVDISIGKGWESLYYMSKVEIPVLELTLSKPSSTIITKIKFRDENQY